MLTICLYGLAGSGKSTAAAEMMSVLAGRGDKVEIIKLAAPLYELQGEVYRTAGGEIGTQVWVIVRHLRWTGIGLREA